MSVKTILALTFILMINLLFFFTQLGISNTNTEDNAPVIMNYDNSFISQYDKGNYTLEEFSADELPNPEAQVNTEGNFFTDIFSTLRNWFLDLSGVNYVVGIVNAVPNFLKACGFAPEIAFALGFFWHALTVFLVVSFLRGG